LVLEIGVAAAALGVAFAHAIVASLADTFLDELVRHGLLVRRELGTRSLSAGDIGRIAARDELFGLITCVGRVLSACEFQAGLRQVRLVKLIGPPSVRNGDLSGACAD